MCPGVPERRDHCASRPPGLEPHSCLSPTQHLAEGLVHRRPLSAPHHQPQHPGSQPMEESVSFNLPLALSASCQCPSVPALTFFSPLCKLLQQLPHFCEKKLGCEVHQVLSASPHTLQPTTLGPKESSFHSSSSASHLNSPPPLLPPLPQGLRAPHPRPGTVQVCSLTFLACWHSRLLQPQSSSGSPHELETTPGLHPLPWSNSRVSVLL